MALAVGALAHGASPVAVNARQSLTVNMGDTITPRFTVRTDSVLEIVGPNIFPRHCGTGRIFLQTLRGSRVVIADTVTVTVKNCIAKLEVCLFPDTAILNKYHFRGDTAADPKLIKCPKGDE